MNDELTRLRAVVAAVSALLSQPGHITRAALAEALAPDPDPITPNVEETV